MSPMATAIAIRDRWTRPSAGTRSRKRARAVRTPRVRADGGLPLRWWIAIAALTAGVVGQLTLRMHVIQLGYRLEEARRTQETLVHRSHGLELELAYRTEPERIARRAVLERGMHLGTPDDVVVER